MSSDLLPPDPDPAPSARATPDRYPGTLTDVAGLAVGHAAVPGRPSGCTVVLCPQGVVGGVAVRGPAPGTRETDLLRPENSVACVHALLLTGGSAFGLDAAGGVMRWLAERGHGLAVGPARVPIVPAAVLFDLWLGDPALHPGADQGYAACAAASTAATAQGNVGAGLGATVGKLFGLARAMKGGLGSASLTLDGVTVAALVAVNAVGDVIDENGRVLAGARSIDGTRIEGTLAALLGGRPPTVAALGAAARSAPSPSPGSATTIGIVATDARLDKAQATQFAALSHHGLPRAIEPLTPHDGDTLFALATGTAARSASGPAASVPDLGILGALGAEVVARAIRNAVRAARPLADPPLPAAGGGGLPSMRRAAP